MRSPLPFGERTKVRGLHFCFFAFVPLILTFSPRGRRNLSPLSSPLVVENQEESIKTHFLAFL
ncbi:hypothetical protein AMJ44_12735 [candidate division WOR-1 bacterium DG_54_3]|uniref:Uncharacterized protein n=1 Tax=candidate division WOR-1 bacterium DG_54_3 TaxID=1703775 RepID=A0A0S7XR02_UNCSA|nr:MAG: hypothetical protein AMJ44_12735 [candidate division WOR-1 bacterium DG_54_3]